MLSPICPMSNPSAADASTEIDTISAEPVRSRMLPAANSTSSTTCCPTVNDSSRLTWQLSQIEALVVVLAAPAHAPLACRARRPPTS